MDGRVIIRRHGHRLDAIGDGRNGAQAHAQAAYNAEHGSPRAGGAGDRRSAVELHERDHSTPAAPEPREAFRTQAELDAEIGRLEREMKSSAANLDFERAAAVRDRLKALRSRDLGLTGGLAVGR
jgi:excinuclease ABC subunit B